MTRKPLPKAITRPIENLRGITAGVVADAKVQAPSSPISFDAVEAEPSRAAAPRPIAREQPIARDLAQAPPSPISFEPVKTKPPPAPSPQPVARDPRSTISRPAEPQAQKRRSLARKVVERHKNYAALGGLVPVPIANIASVTAINMRMVKQLSDLYQVPFQRDRARSMIIGLMGGAVPTGLGAATASTLMFVVPGGALVGLGVSAITAAALTRGIGLVFIESFESNAT